MEYAKWLGMDLEGDEDMFWIAREGLKAMCGAAAQTCVLSCVILSLSLSSAGALLKILREVCWSSSSVGLCASRLSLSLSLTRRNRAFMTTTTTYDVRRHLGERLRKPACLFCVMRVCARVCVCVCVCVCV